MSKSNFLRLIINFTLLGGLLISLGTAQATSRPSTRETNSRPPSREEEKTIYNDVQLEQKLAKFNRDIDVRCDKLETNKEQFPLGLVKVVFKPIHGTLSPFSFLYYVNQVNENGEQLIPFATVPQNKPIPFIFCDKTNKFYLEKTKQDATHTLDLLSALNNSSVPDNAQLARWIVENGKITKIDNGVYLNNVYRPEGNSTIYYNGINTARYENFKKLLISLCHKNLLPKSNPPVILRFYDLIHENPSWRARPLEKCESEFWLNKEKFKCYVRIENLAVMK